MNESPSVPEPLSDGEKSRRAELIDAWRHEQYGELEPLTLRQWNAVRTMIHSAFDSTAPQASPAPTEWREHVEDRLHTWRQSQMNRSGDRLALDDFMDKEAMEDLIDFVCDEQREAWPYENAFNACQSHGCSAPTICKLNRRCQFAQPGERA